MVLYDVQCKFYYHSFTTLWPSFVLNIYKIGSNELTYLNKFSEASLLPAAQCGAFFTLIYIGWGHHYSCVAYGTLNGSIKKEFHQQMEKQKSKQRRDMIIGSRVTHVWTRRLLEFYPVTQSLSGSSVFIIDPLLEFSLHRVILFSTLTHLDSYCQLHTGNSTLPPSPQKIQL